MDLLTRLFINISLLYSLPNLQATIGSFSLALLNVHKVDFVRACTFQSSFISFAFYLTISDL